MPLADSFVRAGKVRDLFAVDDRRLLLVASDRLSAFDVVLPTPIPEKGKVLTGLSRFWFDQTSSIIPNHLLSTNPRDLPVGWLGDDDEDEPRLRGRMMICRKAKVLPVEIIVRGYLSGSGWKDYRATGKVSGITLPAGLRECEQLSEPILTPSTKAEGGAHDEPIDFDRLVGIVGGSIAEEVRNAAIAIYRYASSVTERAGIILADTKFELGIDPETGRLLLVDEVLTPDSSRFWEAAAYQPGQPQASYDKQYVRDWLELTGWSKRPPAPELPGDVVAGTRERYLTAFERITGASFARYLEEDVVAP